MATKTRKPLQALGLADNFLFGEVMQDMGLCKLFLEALLQRPIAKIVNISKEKDLSDAYLAHGIRLDVDLEDENRTRYNIEMQGSSQKSIERRVRYYQSGLDRHFLEQGTDYDSLPNSFVIFVCDYDPYGRGFALYERECRIKDTDILYDDGSHALFLNAKYKTPGSASKDIIEFLDYVRTKNDELSVSGELAKTAIKLCKEKKSDSETEARYMTLQMLLHDERAAAEAIGEARGEARGEIKGTLKTLISLYLDGIIPREIATTKSGLPESEFLAAADDFKNGKI